MKKIVLSSLVLITFKSCMPKEDFEVRVLNEIINFEGPEIEKIYTDGNEYSKIKKDGMRLHSLETNFYGRRIIMEMYYNDSLVRVSKNNGKLLPEVIQTVMVNEEDSTKIRLGHSFDFAYDEYSWLIGDENYSNYKCSFDSEGARVTELGTPKVLEYWNTNYVEILFSTVFINIDSIIVQSKTQGKFKCKVLSNTWLPMTSMVRLNYNKDSTYYIQTYGASKVESSYIIYNDTISYR